MTIQPLDRSRPNPIAGITEGTNDVYMYIQYCGLRQLAVAVWEIASVEDRRALLGHLWDQVRFDGRPPKRFHSLREMLDDCFADREDFLQIAEEGDFSGRIPLELHNWIPLYVDESQGASHAHFTSEAFSKHYQRAHGVEV